MEEIIRTGMDATFLNTLVFLSFQSSKEVRRSKEENTIVYLKEKTMFSVCVVCMRSAPGLSSYESFSARTCKSELVFYFDQVFAHMHACANMVYNNKNNPF
jgi:hypothetical protein